MRAASLLAPFLLACTAEPDDDAATTAATDDLAALARVVEDSATGLPALGEGVTLASGVVDGVGDCAWAWSVEGTPAAGTVGAALEAVPCGGAASGAAGSAEYAVTAGELDGDFAAEGAGWALTLAGERAATLTVDGRRGERAFDATWTLVALEAAVGAEGVGAWSVDLRYEGPAGGTWTLLATGDSLDEASGTLTGPGGRACTVSGSAQAIALDCD